MTKITKTTFKNFIKKNKDKLYIRIDADLDMDEIRINPDKTFKKVVRDYNNNLLEHTLGIKGLWIVGRRDWFTSYKTQEYIGICYNNSCQSGVVVIKR